MSAKETPSASSFSLERVEEPPPDMMSIMAVVFGLMGLLLKYRMFAWQSVVCCIVSKLCFLPFANVFDYANINLMNLKSGELELKNIFSSLSIGVMGLIMAYFGPGANFFK